MARDERPAGGGNRREHERERSRELREGQLLAREERVEAPNGRAVSPVGGGREEPFDYGRAGPDPVGAWLVQGQG